MTLDVYRSIAAITPCAPGWHVAAPVYGMHNEHVNRDGAPRDFAYEILPVCVGELNEYMDPLAPTSENKICEPGTTAEQALAWYLADGAAYGNE